MKNILTVVEVVSQFRKDGKRWALTPKNISDELNIPVKEVQAILNEIVKEGYMTKEDNQITRRDPVGTRKIYSLTELGEKIYLT